MQFTTTRVAVPQLEITAECVADEMAFWEVWFQSRGGADAEEYRRRLDPRDPMQPYIAELLTQPLGARVDVLDVGAGPLTWLGKVLPRRDMHITAIDPLAPHYDVVLAEHGVAPPIRTRFGRAEALVDDVGRNRFDLVHARNCIDHCQDPVSAIDQLVAAAREGAVVFLHHATNEADTQHFNGFHQWNLFGDNGHLMVANRTRTTDVTERLAEVADVETTLHSDGQWMVNVIRKRRRAAG